MTSDEVNSHKKEVNLVRSEKDNVVQILKIKTEELNQPARRPLKSGLITIKAQSELGYKPHTIIQTLELMKKELGL